MQYYPLKPAVLAGLVVSVVYLASLRQGVYPGDSAEFAMGVYSQGIVHPPGYPLYMMLARLWTLVLPFQDFAQGLRAFSAVAGGVSAAAVYACGRKLSGKAVYAALATGLFAFSVPIWREATTIEVYSLHTAITGLCLLVLLEQKPLWMLFLLFGIGLSHHLAMGLVVLCIVPYVFARHWPHWKQTTQMLPLMLLPLLAYLYLPIRFSAQPAFNMLAEYFERNLSVLPDLLWYVRGTLFYPEMFHYSPAAYAGELWRFGEQLATHMLGIGLILGSIGIVWLWRKDLVLALCLIGLFCGQVLFFAGYNVVDKWSMFHTAYLVWALFVAYGLYAAHTAVRIPNGLLWPAVIALVCGQIALSWPTVHSVNTPLPTAQVFEPDALVIGQWQRIRALEYQQQVEGWRPDIVLMDINWLALSLRDRLGTAEYASIQTALQSILSERIVCSEAPVYLMGTTEYIPNTRLEQVETDIFRVISLTECTENS